MKRPVFLENLRNRWLARDALVLLAVAILLCLRRPDMLVNPQLWAEDGTIFLAEQREMGIASLVAPYAGYLHLIPRLVALVVGAAPLTWVPALYTGAAFVLTLLAALWVLHCRVPLPYRAACALAMVVVPHRDEVLLVLVNVQWVLAAVLALLLLQEPPENRRQFIGDLALTILLGLTGPFALLFLPLVFYRLVRDWRDPRSRGIVGAAIITAVIQGLVLLAHPQPIPPPHPNPLAWVLPIFCTLPGSYLVGPELMDYIPGAVLGFASLVLFVLMGATIRSLPPEVRIRVVLLFLAGGIVYGTALRKWGNAPLILNPFSCGHRYFYLAYLLGTWALIIMTQVGRPEGRWISRICLGMMVCVSVFHFTYRPLINYYWRESVQRVEQGEAAKVPINPEGWVVKLRPKGE